MSDLRGVKTHEVENHSTGMPLTVCKVSCSVQKTAAASSSTVPVFQITLIHYQVAVGLNTNGQLRQFNDLFITIQRDWLVVVDIVIIASKIIIIASSSNCR